MQNYNTKELRNVLTKKQGERQKTETSLRKSQAEIVTLKKEIRQHEEAREIVRQVGLKTQKQLQFHISDITSMALEAVFDNPYELVADFVERRNKTECDLLFKRGEEYLNPTEASGGGAVDVASFALRLASYTMQNPKSRHTIILDEPLRFLSVDLQERASRMIKELSERLHLQFIIITHESSLADYADKTFQVSIKKGVSYVG